jgi:hypothetical protein
MRTHLPATLLLLLLLLSATAMDAQSSPTPVIDDYDGTSLPATYQIGGDTTFCKGRAVTIHGQDFKKATGGESWDTTAIYLDGNRVWPQSITSQSNGNDDHIFLALPDIYPSDTCLLLQVVKRTTFLLDTFYYEAKDTVCLTGDKATVSYGASMFCLGDTNPLPQITLAPPTATGGFCCRTGATGFWVNPTTGEIPLHPGAVGPSNHN